MILLVTAQTLVVAPSCAELSFSFFRRCTRHRGDGIYQKNGASGGGGGGAADPFNPVVSRIDTAAAAATRPGGSSSSLLIPICFLLASLHHNRPAQFSFSVFFSTHQWWGESVTQDLRPSGERVTLLFCCSTFQRNKNLRLSPFIF